jgi:2'-5' RNA ligase
VDAWRTEPRGPDLRWTNADGWHVTLDFLGETNPAQIPEVVEDLRRATADTLAFTVPTGGLGAFPGPGRARSIWYGVADPDGRLADLAARVRGDSPDSFQAHVTLARVRLRYGTRLIEWLEGRELPRGLLTVDHIELVRSHLGSGPAQYEVLASLPLGGAASVHG